MGEQPGRRGGWDLCQTPQWDLGRKLAVSTQTDLWSVPGLRELQQEARATTGFLTLRAISQDGEVEREIKKGFNTDRPF